MQRLRLPTKFRLTQRTSSRTQRRPGNESVLGGGHNDSSRAGGSSANYYLGIWFRDDPHQKPIWVADRENPILDSLGVLAIRHDGNLVITDKRQIPMLVNPAMLATRNGTHSSLLDSGDLVLVEGDSESLVWESFFYPCDTLLPGTRIGLFHLGTDKLREHFLISWQTPSVPSTGSFALGLDKNNDTVIRVWHSEVSWEIGYWDSRRFRFLYNSSLDDYNFSYVTSRDEICFTFANRRNASISWFVLTPFGEIQACTMIRKEISMMYSPICENTSSSSKTDRFLEQPLSCGDGNSFSKIQGIMTNPTVFNDSDRLGISDCEIMCRTNCSCTGFASYRDNATGCTFYYEDTSSILYKIGQGNATMFIRGNATGTADQNPRRSVVICPKYAVHGLFSTKSDVFSFGVIMLEIVGGQRNTTFSNLDHSLNLLGYAWELWNSNQGKELMDPLVADISLSGQLLLCLRIALLCVHERPEDRPSVSDIVTALSNENADLPPPKKPAFSAHIGYCNLLHQDDRSTNDISHSVIEARYQL
ncbi:hypothetical protein NL676_035605 [Syzygium grande]|nr:hypothetical protein NL676_035605 [Syzygium grande]